MKCVKCATPVVTHYWIVSGRVYCGPACERGNEDALGRKIKRNRADKERPYQNGKK